MKKLFFSIIFAFCAALSAVSFFPETVLADAECTCLIKCNGDNPECPVCSAEGASVDDCKGRVKYVDPDGYSIISPLQLSSIMTLDKSYQQYYYFALDKDITVDGSYDGISVPEGVDVVIDLNGHSLKGKSNDNPLFEVSGKLTIFDSAGTGKITGFSTTVFKIATSGYVEFCSGEIRDNHSYDVCVYTEGTFNMSGGTMINNTYDINFSDALDIVGGTLIISGNALISCCDLAECPHLSKHDFISIKGKDKRNSYIYANGGIIKGGIYTRASSFITSDVSVGKTEFYGEIENEGIIFDGIFYSDVYATAGYIRGGTYLGNFSYTNQYRVADSAKVTVRFVLESGKTVSEMKVVRGQGIPSEDLPSINPEAYGYEYIEGFSVGDSAYTGGGHFTEDTNNVTVKLSKPISYDIAMDLDGGAAYNRLSYTIEDETFTLVNPEKSGYIFTGWSGTDLEGDQNLTVTIPKGSMGVKSYTAHYAPEALSRVSDEEGLLHAISLGITRITLTNDITLPENLDLSDRNIILDLNGYTITGDIYLSDSSAGNESILTLIDSSADGAGTLDGSITLTKGTGGSVCTLYANGGTVTGSVSMNSTISQIRCSCDTPTSFMGSVGRYGQIFGGIFYGNVASDLIKGNTITFISEDNFYATEVVYDENPTAEPLMPPLKPGFGRLKGWYNGEEKFTFGSSLTENITLTAVFTYPISFTITYNLCGGTAMNLESYTTLDDDITLANPTKEGCKFLGWGGTDLEGIYNMTVTIPKGSIGDREYTAYFTLSSHDFPIIAFKDYTLLFDTDGGNPIEPVTGLKSSDVISDYTPLPTKPGYVFFGWYCGSKMILASDTMKKYASSEDFTVTLTARWREKNAISFNSDPQKYTYDGEAKQFELIDATASDISVSYQQNGIDVAAPTDTGSYDVILTKPESDYTKELNTTIKNGLSIEPCEVTVKVSEIPDAVYTGEPIEPEISVYYGDTQIPDYEYTVEYSNNIKPGTASVTVTDNNGGNYIFEKQTAQFNIKKKSIAPSVTMKNYVYNTAPDAPKVNTDGSDGYVQIYYSTYNDLDTNEAQRMIWIDSDAPTLDTGTYYMIALVKEAECFEAGMTPVISFNVSANKYPKPSSLSCKSKTKTSVTLESIPEISGTTVEYSKDGGSTWQSSPEFNELTPGTTYSFAARYAGTANFNASDFAVCEITTDREPAPTYPPALKVTGSGTASVTPENPEAGAEVTVTAASEDGYGLEKISVTDKNGKPIDLTLNEDGSFSFTQPEGGVTIEITFKDLTEFPFVDVPSNAYYYNDVYWAVKKHITTGTSPTTFSPDEPCTRAQAVTFLWRSAGCPSAGISEMPFTDVPNGSYYEKAVLWALENNITTGTGPTTFSPHDPCIRAQFATFLWRYQGRPEPEDTNPFEDIPETSYYTKAVLWASQNDITTGTSPVTFSPFDTCTRAQAVTFLGRCLNG